VLVRALLVCGIELEGAFLGSVSETSFYLHETPGGAGARFGIDGVAQSHCKAESGKHYYADLALCHDKVRPRMETKSLPQFGSLD